MVRDRDRRTITAAEVRDLASACHAQLSSGARPPVERSRTTRRVQFAAAVVALAVVASGIAWWAQRNSKVRWARQEAPPEIIRLAGADKFVAAYTLAQQAQPYIPDDPLLAEQIRGIARQAVIDSEPAGADVFYRPYGQSGEPWRPLGKTPVAGATVPRGLLHWKVQLAGHEIAEDVGPGVWTRARSPQHCQLLTEREILQRDSRCPQQISPIDRRNTMSAVSMRDPRVDPTGKSIGEMGAQVLAKDSTWWAHFEFTRINIEPTILRKKIEDVREAHEYVRSTLALGRWGSRSAGSRTLDS
jgi:hypothetical protein